MNNYPQEFDSEYEPSSLAPYPEETDIKGRPRSPGKQSVAGGSFKYWVKKTVLVFVVLLIIVAIFFSYKIFAAGEKIFLSKEGNSIISQLKRIILPGDDNVITQEAERINILLIGIRGRGQTKDQGGGPHLADTIILTSLKPKTKEIAMLSIPRDLWVSIDGYGYTKINTAYAYGIKGNNRSGGAELLSQTVQKIMDVPIDYYVVADFVGFEKAVDTVGGIDLEVERQFTDYFYPTWNYEYQTVSFEKGRQHMDGDKALKFVRSRHGTNGEGSDFARARRQQKVLVSLKDKVFSIGTILNPVKLSRLIDSMGNHIITNLELAEALDLLAVAQKIETNQIVNRVLENSEEGLLVASRSDGGASILVPRNGDFTEIQSLAQNIFSPDSKTEAQKEKEIISSKYENEERIKVQIRNGTNVQGLAGKTAVELKEAGYEIISILNADSQDYEKTVIFDNTAGEKTEALEDLKGRLNANVAAGRSFFLDNSSNGRGEDANFVIILGYDQEL